MPLTISDDYTTEDKDVIQFVFSEYMRIFNSEELQKNILVRYCKQDYALTAPKRQNPGQKEDYVIYLNAEPLYWCQIIYQFAHEMSHLIMKCYPEKLEYKWISECFCAAASDNMLKRSIGFFENYSPKCVESVQEYLQNHIRKNLLPENMKISQYIQEHMKNLETDPTEDNDPERRRNNIIGLYLFEVINVNEEGWKAVELFEKMDVDFAGYHELISCWCSLSRNKDELNFIEDFSSIILDNLDENGFGNVNYF